MAPSARQVTCPGVRLPPARAEAPVPEIAELISRGRPCHGLGPACRPGTHPFHVPLGTVAWEADFDCSAPGWWVVGVVAGFVLEWRG